MKTTNTTIEVKLFQIPTDADISKGLTVAYPDTYGQFTQTGVIDEICECTDANLYTIDGGAYMANELRLLTNKKTFKFSFTGRQAGAIGITYQITDTYKAKDIHEAFSLLYEDYDMIAQLQIYEDSKKISQPKEINWIKVRSNHDRPRKKDNATYA